MTVDPSPDGRWELRTTTDYAVNDAGYGNGGWRFELVERATGRVAGAWTGSAQRSPWDESSAGVTAARWDGDELVLGTDAGERRVRPV